MRFGEFELDLSTRELSTNGAKQTLAPQPFQVLELLIQHRGQLVTRDDLIHHLWPSDTFVDYEQGLKKAINRLREALNRLRLSFRDQLHPLTETGEIPRPEPFGPPLTGVVGGVCVRRECRVSLVSAPTNFDASFGISIDERKMPRQTTGDFATGIKDHRKKGSGG